MLWAIKCKAGGNRGAWSLVKVRFKDNPESHKEVVVMKTNLKIDRALNKVDQHTRDEKS